MAASSAVTASTARALLFGLRLWAAVSLSLYLAFWLQLGIPFWAAVATVLAFQPSAGTSLRKSRFMLIGTLVGAVAIVVLAALFPQDRVGFLLGLALWGGAGAFASTVFRNFAGYAAALAGYTTALVAGDLLGATGGVTADTFTLAVDRASEVGLGVVCALAILATTDSRDAQRRLASVIAATAAEIAGGFADTLRTAGSDFVETESSAWRELGRRVIALDQLVDEAIGESFRLRYRSRLLQGAMNGLLAALAAWRSTAAHLTRARNERAQAEGDAVLRMLPPELLWAFRQDQAMRWISAPGRLRRSCEASTAALAAMPADTPTQRLLADRTAAVLTGISHTLDGLALLAGQPVRSIPRRDQTRHLRASDWLPPLVNGARAFAVIGAVELFWIVTAWPSGALAITFAAISVLLLASAADQAYVAATKFVIGTSLTCILAAIVEFLVLPRLENFVGLSLAIGAILLPAGFALAKQWQVGILTPMMVFFIPLIAPANQMNYDATHFFNVALAILGGFGATALSFRVIPPLSQAFRARRLLTLALRDLRRVVNAPAATTIENWQVRIFSRLAAYPDQGPPIERAQLMATISVGGEIIRLSGLCQEFASRYDAERALESLGRGDVGTALAWFSSLDRDLEVPRTQNTLTARASILVICEALTQYRTYFAGASA